MADRRSTQLLSEMKIPQRHHAAIIRWMRGEVDIYDTPAFIALYDYWCRSGEMPYGVAKARTGDPDIWIKGRLEEMGIA